MPRRQTPSQTAPPFGAGYATDGAEVGPKKSAGWPQRRRDGEAACARRARRRARRFDWSSWPWRIPEARSCCGHGGDWGCRASWFPVGFGSSSSSRMWSAWNRKEKPPRWVATQQQILSSSDCAYSCSQSSWKLRSPGCFAGFYPQARGRPMSILKSAFLLAQAPRSCDRHRLNVIFYPLIASFVRRSILDVPTCADVPG